MRITGWGLRGAVVLATIVAACGGDDATDERDASADTGGASGRAGSDAGRADGGAAGTGGTAGKGGTAGTGGTAGSAAAGGSAGVAGAAGGTGGSAGAAGNAGSAGSAGRAGSNDASIDRASDVTEVDTGPDLRVDVAADVDANNIVDSASDSSDSPSGDTVIADAGDATTVDASETGGDASADTSDAADARQDTFDAPSCNDSNPATWDFYSPLYGCGHKFDVNPNDSDAWITYDVGFHVDVATGLGWVFPPGSRSASAAATECNGFSVAGLVDWRIPTIDDSRSLAGGCAPTAPGGTCPISDPGCLSTNCGYQSPACDSCMGGAGPHSSVGYCKLDVPICSFFHTSSLCTDCGDAGLKDWIYIPINGNFYPFDSPAGIPTACVSVVPGGVPAIDGG